MFFADRFIRQFGARRALLSSLLLSSVKLILIVLFPAIWSVLVNRALDGIAFSLLLIGLVNYVKEHASRAHTATMLALFGVTLTAFIQIIGALMGGLIFDAVGAYPLYALAMVGNFVAWLIFLRAPK
jgi:MFS family permease